MGGVPTVIVLLITMFPQEAVTFAVRVITPLLFFVNVVWGRLGVPGVAIPEGVVDHETVAPAGKPGIVYGLEVLQNNASPGNRGWCRNT